MVHFPWSTTDQAAIAEKATKKVESTEEVQEQKKKKKGFFARLFGCK